MGSGGALLVCSLFFLYVAQPACCCPVTMSRLLCKRETPPSAGGEWCMGHLLRCRGSSMEIKFGGTGEWYRVAEVEEPNHGDAELEIEDTNPTLISTFTENDCDFLYTFPHPGPLFAPLSDLRFDRSKSVDSSLFSELQHDGPCTPYHLFCTSEEQDPQNTIPGSPSTPPCFPPVPSPAVIWRLSVRPEPHGNDNATFTVISVGFSRRRLLYRRCFDGETTGQHCDAGSAGDSARPCNWKCGKKRGHMATTLGIGFSTAAGLCVLAGLLFYLWRGNRKTKTPSHSTLLSQAAPSEPSIERDPEAASNNYPTHVFRYDELHEATNGFSRSNELDHGGHGAVYRGTLPDGRAVAIKRLYENSCKRAELFMNEIAILSRLRHPHLVAWYGCTSRHSRELLLVYELIPNGTIADHLHGHRAAEGALTWPVRLRIAVETAMALAYLHAVEPPIVHRDVKTKNILLDGDFHVKVADFGLSRLFPMAASHVSTVPQGTPGYVDPEYHRCYQLTDKSDVYSFGVVLAELISSKPAVDVTRHRHEINLSNMALNKIQNAALQELVDPKLGFETGWEVTRSIELVADLVKRCLQGERVMRPTMEGVLEVLRGIEGGLHQAGKEGEADRRIEDQGLQKDCVSASPDSVMGKWSSSVTTPNASG